MELLKINYGVTCTSNCIDCPYYFSCTSDVKKSISKIGRMQLIRERMSKIENKVAVIGGKGGVGKSTVSATLAISLAEHYRVGIIDSDFDGPCIPKILGVDKKRMTIADEGIIPVTGPLNIKVVSTGFLLDEDEFTVWFHDLKRSALEEYLAHIYFGELDYLVFDLPPGTSSETANMFKYLPDLGGVVVVTIPSELSQNVARRAIKLSQQAGVKVVGVIENMSGTVCPECGTVIAPFQIGGGEKLAERLEVPFLGRIPLDPRISQCSDNGKPFILENDAPEAVTSAFKAIVEKIIAATKA
jgi:ATP-binding protein involved in chromosome partitioning